MIPAANRWTPVPCNAWRVLCSMQTSGKGMRIEFLGDSLTAGAPGSSFVKHLERLLPNAEMRNRGKSGDTVISLHRRITREAYAAPVDVAVLWIGVNDVFSQLSSTHRWLKRLTNQPWARDQDEFRDHYTAVIELLRVRTQHIVTVAPFLMGEQLSNPWNTELEELGRMISLISDAFAEAHYLDLRSRLTDSVDLGQSSSYLPRSIARIGLDLLFVRTPAQIDRVSASRGLGLTLDGVHLNRLGARWVAEQIDCAIRPLLGA